MITPRFTIDTKKGKKNCPIRARYSINNVKVEYYTRLHVDEMYYVPKYWKGNKKIIKSIAPQSDYINEQLDIIVSHFHAAENKALAAGITLTAQYFKDSLDGKLKNKAAPKEPKQLTFIKFFDGVVEGMKTSHQVVAVTRRRYATVKTMLEGFEKQRGKAIQWDEFDNKLFNQLDTYQIEEKEYSLNTIGRNTRTIKTILNKAIQDGFTVNIKYQGAFKSKSEAVDNAYLTEAELDKLWEKDFSGSPKNDRVRDIFLIGCYTGLRFSDYINIKPEHINGENIKILTQKTRKQVIIPLHKRVKTILEKYNYQLPPPISNQKFNEYLGDVCSKAEINDQYSKSITKAGKVEIKSGAKHEFITSHSARRTFASNMFKRGVSPYLIMAITGHKTESEFMKYLKVTADDRAEMFAKEAKW